MAPLLEHVSTLLRVAGRSALAFEPYVRNRTDMDSRRAQHVHYLSPKEIELSLTKIKRWFAAFPQRSAVLDLIAPTAALNVMPDTNHADLELPCRRISRSDRAHERTRQWRRRALMRKGARLYPTKAWEATFASLAMLDDEGLVIGWYERTNDWNGPARLLVDSHVSRLYTAEDAGLGIPMRELSRAAAQEESVQTGWRLGIDGRKFWATTTIRAVRLRDGRLQGFSHLICRSPIPWSIPGEQYIRRLKSPLIHLQNVRPSRGATLLAALLAFGTPVMAGAATPLALPPNAKASGYGSRWECAHGYQRVRDACEKVSIPANAHLDPSGNRWRCDRGFVSTHRECVRVEPPANAYLDESFSAGWRCDRRFREEKGRCLPIVIPKHAHEVDSSYGDGWACNYGYVARSGACQAVNVPANAFLTRSGEEWKCDRGFMQTSGVCVAVNPPANGFVDDQGNGWACKRGFRKTESACEAVSVPANAHLDWSGDRWRCDRGFTSLSGTCAED
jgi:hypothetical protein